MIYEHTQPHCLPIKNKNWTPMIVVDDDFFNFDI